MSPDQNTQKEDTLVPKEEHHIKKWKIFAFVLPVIVLIGVFCYLANKLYYNPAVPPAKNSYSVLTDAVTGKPIPQEEIDKTVAEQKINKKTLVLFGEVLSSENNAIVMKTDIGNIKIYLDKEGTVLKTGTSTEETVIPMSEIKKGDSVSVTFPQGKTNKELLGGTRLVVKNIEVFSQE